MRGGVVTEPSAASGVAHRSAGAVLTCSDAVADMISERLLSAVSILERGRLPTCRTLAARLGLLALFHDLAVLFVPLVLPC